MRAALLLSLCAFAFSPYHDQTPLLNGAVTGRKGKQLCSKLGCKKYDINGIPFMDTRCSVSEPTTNYLIYGHNMKNGSMFSALLNYEQEDFYREHPRIRFDTVYEPPPYRNFSRTVHCICRECPNPPR